MSDQPIPIIDAWANPAIKEMFQSVPEIARLFRQSGATHLLEKGVSADEMIGMMDTAGIERLCMTTWARPGISITSNDRIAEFLHAYPKRFVGMATVNLEKPVEAVRELDRAVRQLGFKALRVIPWLWNRPPNDKLYYPLYVKCIDLDIPFCTQVGHTGPLMPSEPGRPIPYIDEVALTFPELRILGGHIGYPWTDEMISLAWKHENVYIDTSAYLPRYYPPQLIHFMNTYGSDKVLFGTNFPMLALETCAEQARALPLKPEAKAKFLRRMRCECTSWIRKRRADPHAYSACGEIRIAPTRSTGRRVYSRQLKGRFGAMPSTVRRRRHAEQRAPACLFRLRRKKHATNDCDAISGTGECHYPSTNVTFAATGSRACRVRLAGTAASS